MVVARSRLWLPFTQMSTFDPDERRFVRGRGTRLRDDRGRDVFDAVSSIWTIVHGHCHPTIVAAIQQQAETLDHATLLGATNPQAEELAERLCALTRMDAAFFASDGASAIEAGLKMALHFWQHAGEPRRTRFVRLVDAYHGDTAGAMSVSDISVFKQRYGALTFESLPFQSDAMAALERDDVAAVIVEPIVQAAAGMRMIAKDRYEPLRAMRPLLFVDEIATGFGRTGTMFAFEQLDLRPDLLALGKGITGGTLALSATLASDRIYRAFLGNAKELRQFFHGHSYAGNPIACAAALANLRVFDDERTLEGVEQGAAHVRRRLRQLAASPFVRDVRAAGLMAGIELDSGRVDARDCATPAWRIVNELYGRGHFTRPIGDTIQFVPPLSAQMHEVDDFFDALVESLA